MHSGFLKCNRLLMKVSVKEVIYLNYGVRHPSLTRNFAFVGTQRGIGASSGSCGQSVGVCNRSQINSNRKCFANEPQNNRMLHIPQKFDVKACETAKFKGKSEKRKTAVIAESGDTDRFGVMEDFIIENTLDRKLGENSSFHEDCEIFVPLERKHRSSYDYLKGMKDLLKENKLKQALELFLDMKRHQVPAMQSHYTLMIGACGRAGYTEMAFKLLRQMTDKGFKPTPATLTGLFNSCAESPKAHYGLQKAIFLKEKIVQKSWKVAIPTYRAMIKAFGRCGDIKTAFEVVDEMIESGCKVSVETYNTLLVACVTDKAAGFTYAIEVWRKMISKNLCPDIYSYNLLLRAVRDCGVGPEEVSCTLLHHWSSSHTHLFNNKNGNFLMEDVLTLPQLILENDKLLSDPLFHGDETEFVKQKATLFNEGSIEDPAVFPVCNNRSEYVVPSPERANNLISCSALNLLLPRPSDGPKFIDLENLRNPADRLFLIGGMKGFLELMRKDKVTPDIKTFTMLLKIIPNRIVCENELLEVMENYKLKPDIDFYNMLIKKRNFRKDFRASKEVLVLIAKKGLCPDIVTFGVLALGCTKKKDGLQLLHDMKNFGFSPNIEIFGALLNSASRSVDLEYICTVMKTMTSEQIKPSLQFLKMLEDIKSTVHGKIIELEQSEGSAKCSFSRKSYNEFCQVYEQWLKTTDVEERTDPWLQFKTEITYVQ